MKSPRKLLLAIALLLPLACRMPALAEIIHLTDGSTLEGEVKHTDDGWEVKTPDGKITHLDSDRVKTIELMPRNTPDAAEGKLASLRRSVENSTDIKDIIVRYERFIDQNKTSTVATEAQKDLAAWQDRLAQNMIKVGSKWMTASQKAQLQGKQANAVEHVRDLFKQGRMKEADEELTEVVQIDPSNISAQYLRGLILFKQEQLDQAKKCFDAVCSIVPSHGPTLNNIAVVLWRQKQYIMAINFYDQALTTAPGTRQIIDNAAEALGAAPMALTAGQMKAPVVLKMERHFNEQDATLQLEMKSQGQYRWGATWVDKAQLDQLKAVEKQNDEKVAQMSTEFDAASARIARLDEQVADIVKQMKRFESLSWGQDAFGNWFRLPLPQAYFDDDRDAQKLKMEKTDLLAKQDGLRDAAKKINQNLPAPKYTGLQQMIGIEGTPLLGPLHATPTTEPVNPLEK